MKAIVFESEKQLIKKDLPYPEQKPGHAIIKMLALGICGSDIHAFDGTQPMFSYPKIVGHEIAAEIVESDAFEKGQMVTIVPYIECGECIACLNGKHNACEKLSVLGVHQDGGLSEYLSVPEDKILPIQNMTAKQAAMIEPLAISEHAFSRVGACKDEIIAVSGVGPIGMGIIIMAKFRGAKVIAIDFNEDRLTYAKNVLKADFTLKPDETLIDEIRKITNHDMVTKVFDATGNKYAMNNAVNLLSHGGSMVFVGLHNDNIDMVDLAFHKREASLFASRAAFKKDFQTVIDMINSGFFNPEALVTSTFTLDDFIEVFPKAIRTPNQIKSVVLF